MDTIKVHTYKLSHAVCWSSCVPLSLLISTLRPLFCVCVSSKEDKVLKEVAFVSVGGVLSKGRVQSEMALYCVCGVTLCDCNSIEAIRCYLISEPGHRSFIFDMRIERLSPEKTKWTRINLRLLKMSVHSSVNLTVLGLIQHYIATALFIHFIQQFAWIVPPIMQYFKFLFTVSLPSLNCKAAGPNIKKRLWTEHNCMQYNVGYQLYILSIKWLLCLGPVFSQHAPGVPILPCSSLHGFISKGWFLFFTRSGLDLNS